ncbi:MAG: IMP cyclohydrolase [Desulfovibrionaceae bacterium]
MELLPIKRAILSVTDKTGLPELARFLSAAGVELVSTGGTRKLLTEAGLTVTSVSDVTGFPEIMGGRVKTLHPAIHGGILADKDNPEHLATLASLGIATFDMVVVNLYAFDKALQKGLPLPGMVEQIDIGGPTLLRASAKNFNSILVVPDPAFYPEVMDTLAQNAMQAPLALRQKTAAATFRKTSTYDDAIATYLANA